MNNKLMNRKMNCQEANEMSITNFLLSQGFEPKRISGNNYWYLSPLRNESTPSFKVDITINRWYDHGVGTGGKLVDLGIRLFEVDVSEFLEKIKSQNFPDSFSFQKPESQSAITVIKKVKKLENKALLSYLSDRAIHPLWVAENFCQEIYFSVHAKNYFGIGFKNDLEGYEIRNKYFKGCIGHKAITTILSNSQSKTDAKTFVLFEGFFDFLSGFKEGEITNFSYIILNSVNQIPHAVSELQRHCPENVVAYFDNDEAGKKCFAVLKSAFPKAIDHSNRYEEFKDVNEKAIHTKLKYHG